MKSKRRTVKPRPVKSSRLFSRAPPQLFTQDDDDDDEDLSSGLSKEQCNGGSGNRKLLVCTEMGCPIALHVECMCAKPVFDEMGNFYCPYCAYKLKFVRTQKLRRKAMASKRVLSKFIDAGEGNGCGYGDGQGGGEVRDQTLGIEGGEPEQGDNEPRREIENVGGGERIDEDQQEGEVVEETPEVDAEPENACYVQEKTNKDHGHDGLDQGDEEGIRVSKENEDKSDDEEQRQPEANVCGRSVSRESSKGRTASEFSFIKDSAFSIKGIILLSNKNLVLPNGKRKKLNWTGEEVEMLKEGVRIYKAKGKKIPWTQILEFGHNVFHITRLPADLKDKWRNLIGRRTFYARRVFGLGVIDNDSVVD
ncbi:Homeodomain-like protein with RING/FYVE/PHD-type zinc finger domain [Prunus dulcis]|uniref:Homeodomain-like protein with RING/FYVE/PHD-type zinc finger domain n=1 Tax=Prunus dulcis TaxID=3755 RepID=A0A4Y1R6V1_PRUDU|nr:Homeodomain-like protein with RING/FYVE/PHD-type zinc finger domain [Prunus dulcis]